MGHEATAEAPMTGFGLAQPSAPEINARVRALLELGDPLARRLVQQLLSRFPTYADGWVTASAVSCRFGDAAGALTQVERALVAYPRDPSALLQKAHCLLALEHREEARSLVETAIQRAGDWSAIRHDAAYLYTQLGEFGTAYEQCSAALRLRPRDPEIYADRAGISRILGDLKSAETDLDCAIRLDPKRAEWYLNRTQLRRQTEARNHVVPILSLLRDNSLGWRNRVRLLYTLGKELEDMEHFDAAFESFIAAATLRRQHLNYNVTDEVVKLSRIESVFSMEQLNTAPPTGVAGPTPIFVIGMPRSGTTLVERILGSLPGVHPAGELDVFGPALLAAATREAGDNPEAKLSLVDRSVLVNARLIGEEYLRRAIPSSGRRHYFVDKTPTNFLYCGLIARSLPRAIIVHVSRHPLANCFGMFKTLFAQGYPFSYAFNELAQYYAAYRSLMRHWSRSMPGRIVEINYERLVTNPERETRDLANACGIAWTSRCLSFHELDAPATSHSAAQIRQPLYLTAIDHWRRYGQQLKSLKEQLMTAGLASAELL